MKGGQSKEVGSKESQREGSDKHKELVKRTRAGWKGEDLMERRFSRTRSRWSSAVKRDSGLVRRRILVVRPRMAVKRAMLVGDQEIERHK
jgi:hypothetical protein